MTCFAGGFEGVASIEYVEELEETVGFHDR